MGWLFLIIAILFEVAAALCLKYSESLTRLWPSILLFVFYGLCFLAMIKALEYIQLGAMYAIWGGMGTALVAFFSWMLFKEPMSTLKVTGIALIVAGVFLTNFHITENRIKPSEPPQEPPGPDGQMEPTPTA